MADPHKVVILGGGFGGLSAAQALKNAPVASDARGPLQLSSISAAALSGCHRLAFSRQRRGPLRQILRKQKNTQVLLGEAVHIDAANRRVILSDGALDYDTLIVATGSTHQYFGHDEWEKFAPGLKNRGRRHRDAPPHPAGLRGCRTRTRPAKTARVDDIRDRGCWAHRRGTSGRAW